jgi:hypothetical protein
MKSPTKYYLKQFLTKAETRNYLGCSDTSLDRLSKEYPMIKEKINQSRSVTYIREEIDKVIREEYD